MEFPELGKHCQKKNCNRLDFLPIKCDACSQLFCTEHYHYSDHNCPKAHEKNVQVPVCPLCNSPVPIIRGQLPDVAVEIHIDDECQADTAKSRRKVFANKCMVRGCKNKEAIPILCNDCLKNFCLKHRHPIDHKCQGRTQVFRTKTLSSNLSEWSSSSSCTSKYQSDLSEDKALAQAIALSLLENSDKKFTQEELDFELAKQLQASENGTVINQARSSKDRCNVS